MITSKTSAPSKFSRAVILHALAHARSGDKGNRVNIGLFAYRPETYPLLVREVTVERVADLFVHRNVGAGRRYDLPNGNALNFVIDGVLQGGVNASLNLDGHGKTLASYLLSLQITVPAEFDADFHGSTG